MESTQNDRKGTVRVDQAWMARLFYNIFPTKSRKDTTVDDYWESQSCVIPCGTSRDAGMVDDA